MNNYKEYVCYILSISSLTLDKVLEYPNYKTFQIPKKSGGFRKISAPCYPLKQVQQKLNTYILSKYTFLECLYGFVKGKSIVDHAFVHNKAKYIVNIDLKNFFPTIHFGRVRGIFLNTPFSLPERVATILARIACFQNALPQGSPCSPSLSNIVCYTLDKQLLSLGKQYHFTYTRYADDITLSSDTPFSKEIVYRTKENIVVLGKKLRNCIEKQGFIINETKTKYSWNNERKEVTGLIINEKVNTKKIYVKQLRALLHKAEVEGLLRTSKDYFAREKHYYMKRNKPERLIKELRKVMEGRLNFLGMVRGEKDFVYQRYVKQYLEILHKEGIYSHSIRKKIIEEEE